MTDVQKYLPAVTIALLLLVAWLAAKLTWLAVALMQPAPMPDFAVADVARAEPPAAEAYNLQNILAVPLFGEKVRNEVAAREVKRSTLRIRLLGVVAGGERGIAILQHEGDGRAYAVGDRLDMREAVTLAAVYPEYVIIDRNGSQEKIELEADGKATAGAGIRQVPRTGTDATATVDLGTDYVRKLIGDPRDTLKNNPLRLMRFLSASPYTQNGRTLGFQVNPGRDARLFSHVGLEPGDVVLSINNTPLGDAKLPDLINSLDESTAVELQVLRNGVPQTIRLTL